MICHNCKQPIMFGETALEILIKTHVIAENGDPMPQSSLNFSRFLCQQCSVQGHVLRRVVGQYPRFVQRLSVHLPTTATAA